MADKLGNPFDESEDGVGNPFDDVSDNSVVGSSIDPVVSDPGGIPSTTIEKEVGNPFDDTESEGNPFDDVQASSPQTPIQNPPQQQEAQPASPPSDTLVNQAQALIEMQPQSKQEPQTLPPPQQQPTPASQIPPKSEVPSQPQSLQPRPPEKPVAQQPQPKAQPPPQQQPQQRVAPVAFFDDEEDDDEAEIRRLIEQKKKAAAAALANKRPTAAKTAPTTNATPSTTSSTKESVKSAYTSVTPASPPVRQPTTTPTPAAKPAQQPQQAQQPKLSQAQSPPPAKGVVSQAQQAQQPQKVPQQPQQPQQALLEQEVNKVKSQQAATQKVEVKKVQARAAVSSICDKGTSVAAVTPHATPSTTPTTTPTTSTTSAPTATTPTKEEPTTSTTPTTATSAPRAITPAEEEPTTPTTTPTTTITTPAVAQESALGEEGHTLQSSLLPVRPSKEQEEEILGNPFDLDAFIVDPPPPIVKNENEEKTKNENERETVVVEKEREKEAEGPAKQPVKLQPNTKRFSMLRLLTSKVRAPSSPLREPSEPSITMETLESEEPQQPPQQPPQHLPQHEQQQDTPLQQQDTPLPQQQQQQQGGQFVSVEEYLEMKSKLLAHIELLTAEYEMAVLERYQVNQPTAEGQIELLCKGKPYSFVHFRSLEEKAALMAAAVNSGDPNAIMAVIYFLKETVLPELFVQVLASQDKALHLYANHLKHRKNTKGQIYLYQNVKDTEREIQALLRNSAKLHVPHERLSAYNACVALMKLDSKKYKFYISQMEDQIKLLNLQLAIESRDATLAKQGSRIFIGPRPTVMFTSLAYTMHYTIFYHQQNQGNSSNDKKMQYHPEAIVKEFKVSDKRYLWLRLLANAKKRNWQAVKELPSTSFFSSKPKSCIGFEPFVMAVLQNNGPVELVVEFLNMMEPTVEKYDVAMLCHQYHIAIDTLVAQGDRVELLRLKKILKFELGLIGYHEYKNRINDLLENKKIKWRT